MKKLRITGLILATIFCAVLGMSCQNDTVSADDGANIRDYSSINKGSSGGSSGSGGGAGAANWALCKNSAYEIFDVQVWGDGAGTFEFENKDGFSTFKITSTGGGWIGGGLVAAETGKTFDFSKVAKMTFEIRGTINQKSLCIGVQGSDENAIFPTKAALSTEIKSDEWTKVTMDVSSAQTKSIINAFMIIGAADWGTAIKEGDSFDIRNLDWLDSAGNSVTLELE